MQEGTEFLPNPVHEVEVVPAPQVEQREQGQHGSSRTAETGPTQGRRCGWTV